MTRLINLESMQSRPISAPSKAAHSVIKWCGGKTRVIPHILPHLPEKIGTYFEPFVGGASLFFELHKQNRFEQAVLADMNFEVVNAYRVIQDNVEELITTLNSGEFFYDKAQYLAVRAWDLDDLVPKLRAARFIYLNRTCFNGLYRENKKGQFNVPFGKYTNPTICDAENLRAVSRALQGVKIFKRDFEDTPWGAQSGDVVYFDPPYIPLTKTANFTGYNGGGFSLWNQERLATLARKLASQGVCVILSNSSAPKVRELYEGFQLIEIEASRNVGGPVATRKPVIELLIVGRPSNQSPVAGASL